MREIGQFTANQPSAPLADYLLTLGIKTDVRKNANGTESIWAIDENRLNEARTHFSAYLENPNDTRFETAARTANKLRKAEIKLDREYAKRVQDAGSVYESGNYLRKTPVVKLLIALSIGVTLWTNFGAKTELVRDYINFASPRYDMNDGWVTDSLEQALGKQPWRLIAPMFLHFGFMHLFFNMSWLSHLGGMIEREKRSWFLLFLVTFTHIASAFTEYFWEMYGLHRTTIIFGGFSGAVYGLIGFAWMYAEYNRSGYIRLSPQNIQLAVVWMVLCFTGALGPIANGAHFGGFAAGMILGMISGIRDARRT